MLPLSCLAALSLVIQQFSHRYSAICARDTSQLTLIFLIVIISLYFYKFIKVYKFFNVLLISYCVISCGSDHQPKFTPLEKEQAHYLLEAIELDNQAARIVNAGQANTYTSQESIDKISALRQQALSMVKRIPTGTLAKMHPDLPVRIADYKKGLALEIDCYQNRNTGSCIKGSKLLDTWADWFNAPLTDIKVPKR